MLRRCATCKTVPKKSEKENIVSTGRGCLQV